MNARCTLVVFMISSCSFMYAQDSLIIQDDTPLITEKTFTGMKRFSVSVNPAGLIFFGPMLNAEVGLGENIRFNTHVRLPNGLFSQFYYSNPEKLRGYGIGGGIMGFFGEEGNWGKPYFGFLVEYSKTTTEYYYDPLSSYYTGGGSTYEMYIFALHAGYRFRFRKGFFIQTGIYFFLPIYDDWPTRIIPLPQPDIRFGFEF